MPRLHALAALLVGVAMAPLGAQTNEGYDPLRQITQQVIPARLLIVLDTTGSMQGDVNGKGFASPTLPKDSNGNPIGTDSTGQLYWTTSSGNCSSGKCSTWTYKLTFERPSRMSTVKNALGNTVSIVPSFTGPSSATGIDGWKNYWANLGRTPNPYLCGAGCTGAIGWPADSASGPWTWTVKFTKSGSPFQVANPGPPLHVACGDGFPGAPGCTIADFPKRPPICDTKSPPAWACAPRDGFPLTPSEAGTKAVLEFAVPADVIGTNKDQVSWGLIAFSSEREVTSCAEMQLLAPIDTVNTLANIGTIEKYLWLTADSIPGSLGLHAGGNTPTIGALAHAKNVLSATFQGGTLSVTSLDSSNSATAADMELVADPKAACNPPYGVILATDGLSNKCNAKNKSGAGKNWISPGGACPGPSCMDVGSSGFDCPGTPSLFAAQQAHDIWNLNLSKSGSPVVHPRTWTIGVSTQVGPCELDFIAYCGRTDASSPNGDAGYVYAKDYYMSGGTKKYLLPQADFAGTLPNPTISSGTFGENYDGPTGMYAWYRDTTLKPYSTASKPAPYNQHGDYAFFASQPGAVAEAFSAIVNATATGDYATSPPTTPGGSQQTGETIFLTSSDFPGWRGHLYKYLVTFPVDGTGKPLPPVTTRQWDAGSLLQDPAARKIYTWDPVTNDLLEVTGPNRPALQLVAGASGLADATTLTDNVIDFIRGYDGTLSTPKVARPWILGPLINTTPSITTGPFHYTQGNVADHTLFEQTYSSRRTLVWAGSDDGMLHAFDAALGREELAIVPPDMLAVQVQLYANYKSKNNRVTGQPDRITAHLYGVANSLRYGDVFLASDNAYHTLGFLTEGPGGQTIAALDITHPYGGNTSVTPNVDKDKYYDASAPVKVLWSATGGSARGQLTGLNRSWSIPALAATSSTAHNASTTWTLLFGSGFDAASTSGTQGTPGVAPPYAFTADISSSPTSPSFSRSTLAPTSSPTPRVGDQAFADSVVVSTRAAGFKQDNIADLGMQADLNGRIWFLAGQDLNAKVYIGIDVNAAAKGIPQPLYYPPAVSGYGPNPTSCDSFAFGSGTFYERSPAVTGPGVGTGTSFIPTLYIAVNPKPAVGSNPAVVPAGNILSIPIAGTWQISNDGGKTFTPVVLQPGTQLTSSPFLISDPNGKGPVQALFAVFDPSVGCNGESYVLSITFTIPNCNSLVSVTEQVGYDAGARAISGITVPQAGVILASVSGVGEGQQATAVAFLVKQNAKGSSMGPVPVWWKEHK